MELIKNLLRLIFFFPAVVLALTLRALGIKLIFLDTTRIGHFFCDLHLFVQGHKESEKFVFCIPLNKASISGIDDFLPTCCRTIYSPFLAKFVGWFRHFSLLVVNVTNSHTHISDDWFFRRVNLKNRFRELTRSFSSDYMFEAFKNVDKAQNQGEYVAFHSRSGWDDDDAQSFRNTDRVVSEKFCSYLVENGYRVINIGAEPIDLLGVENPRTSEHFHEPLILEIILRSSIFVGDSSGPTMVAILANKPSLIFDIFPPEIFPLNSASLVHHLKVSSKTKTDESDDLLARYGAVTLGSDFEKLGLTYSKLSHDDVETLVDEFVDLQTLGSNCAQKLLQEQYMNRFKVTREMGYLSHKCKPDYL